MCTFQAGYADMLEGEWTSQFYKEMINDKYYVKTVRQHKVTKCGQKSEYKEELCCVYSEFRFYTLNLVHKTLSVHMC